MTTYTESFHTAGFIVSEEPRTRSRDQITLISGQNLKAGTVLGKLTIATSAPVYAATGGNTGNFTSSAVTETAALLGVYRGEFFAATKYNVYDPNGVFVAEGATGVAFASGGIGFTLTAGGTPAAAGDSFTITVAANAGAGKFAAFDPTAADGSETAGAILYDDCDATSADQQATAFTRAAEINKSELVWGANVTTTPQKTAAYASLALVGLIGR